MVQWLRILQDPESKLLPVSWYGKKKKGQLVNPCHQSPWIMEFEVHFIKNKIFLFTLKYDKQDVTKKIKKFFFV